MSEKPLSLSDDLNTFERYNSASHEGVEIMRWTEEGGFSGPTWDCYQACHTINPQSPVTVAENIGELVSFVSSVAATQTPDEPNDDFEPDWDATAAQIIYAARKLAAKLKAQP